MKHRCPASAVLALALAASPALLGAAPIELKIDPARSGIYALTHAESFLGAGGSEHAIAVTGYTLDLCLEPDRPSTPGWRLELDMPVSGLELDTPEARAGAGASGEMPPAADIERLKARLLGPEGLDAAHHPTLHYSAVSIEHPSASYPVIHGKLMLRGLAVPQDTRLEINKGPNGTYHILGGAILRQSDFGIQTVTVDNYTEIGDSITFSFDLWATPTGKPCTPAPPQKR